MTATVPTAAPPSLAERVAAAVTAHPSVARLHGGEFAAVATYLPRRRLLGVRIGAPGEPVELAVVLYLNRPFPEVAGALRRTVAAMCGGAAVDITVADIEVERVSEPAAQRVREAPSEHRATERSEGVP